MGSDNWPLGAVELKVLDLEKAPVEPDVRGLQGFEVRRVDGVRTDPDQVQITPAA